MKNNKLIVGFHLPDEPYGCLSNWYSAEFNLAGIHYYNSEQYMMRRKVLLADRYDLATKIMETDNPAKIKKYAGPEYFHEFGDIEQTWNQISKNVVKGGVRAKFAQNKKLMSELLNTGNALLAECARQDRVWGIGINLHDDSWHDVSLWTGNNYLGRILMELREEFRTELRLFGTVQSKDYRNARPSNAWKMTAGMLKRIPQYYNAIHTYAAQLPTGYTRESFFYNSSLHEWEKTIGENLCGGLPETGFYEMKQEIFEIEHRLNK